MPWIYYCSNIIIGGCFDLYNDYPSTATGATDENGVSGLVSVDMTCSQVSSLLSRHWRKDSDKVKDELITGGFMEVIERQLQDYIKNMSVLLYFILKLISFILTSCFTL